MVRDKKKEKKKVCYPIAKSLGWSMGPESMSAGKEGRKEGGERVVKDKTANV